MLAASKNGWINQSDAGTEIKHVSHSRQVADVVLNVLIFEKGKRKVCN
jgi:hypothetical protein